MDTCRDAATRSPSANLQQTRTPRCHPSLFVPIVSLSTRSQNAESTRESKDLHVPLSARPTTNSASLASLISLPLRIPFATGGQNSIHEMRPSFNFRSLSEPHRVRKRFGLPHMLTLKQRSATTTVSPSRRPVWRTCSRLEVSAWAVQTLRGALLPARCLQTRASLRPV